MDWLSQLPEGVLWTILGFLDLPTLYSARLVCKRVRNPAAGCFKSLECTTLEELFKADFMQFSGTTYLGVTVFHESDLQYLVDPRISSAVTHVSLKGLHLWGSHTAGEVEAVLMRLPSLRSVSLRPSGRDTRLPLFPPRLEELKIETWPDRALWANVVDASPLTRCSHLTSLAIDLRVGAGTSLEGLSSLCNLRSLDLCSCSSAAGLLSTLTALTRLTFEPRWSGGWAGGSIFYHLGRLTGLSRLGLWGHAMPGVVTHEHLTCIGQLTNLACLVISGCTFAENIYWSDALLPLTRLVSLGFSDPDRRPRLSKPQVENLECLWVRNYPDAVLLLGTATRLTRVILTATLPKYSLRPPWGLSPALAGLLRLRCLYLDLCGNVEYDSLDSILRACTMLTQLYYRDGELRPDSDLQACAALPGLRSLSFAKIRQLTPAWLPALQAMTGLTELCLLNTEICVADMTPDVIAAFDAERRRLGWPLLKLRVEDRNGRRLERLERSTECAHR